MTSVDENSFVITLDKELYWFYLLPSVLSHIAKLLQHERSRSLFGYRNFHTYLTREATVIMKAVLSG